MKPPVRTGIILIILSLIISLKLLYVDFGQACHNDAACPHNPTSMSVGVTLPSTGPAESVGKSMKNAYQLWATEVNNRGGIANNKVNLVFEDDGGNIGRVVDNFKKFIKEDVDIIFGHPWPGALPAVLAPIQTSQYPVVFPSSSGAEWHKKSPYGIMLLSPMENYLGGAIKTAKELRLERVALVLENNFSPQLITGVENLIKETRLDLVDSMIFNLDERDFTTQLAKLKNANVEAVLFFNSRVKEAINFTKQIKERMPGVKFLSITTGAGSDDYRKSLGSLADRVFRPAVWHEKLKTPGNVEFFNRYQDTYNERPDNYAARAYAVAKINEKALTEVFSSQGYLRLVLPKLKTSTILGRFEIGKEGAQIGYKYLLIQQQNGQEEILWPKEYATAEPVI